MRNRVARMIFHYKRHKLSVWSSFGLLAVGIATLTLWLFNMPLFLQFVGYAASVCYILDIEAGFMEEKVIGNSQGRLGEADFFWLKIAQMATAIIGIIELGSLIYCQITNYYKFVLTAVFLTGLYFTHWIYNYGLTIYQVKRDENVAVRKYLIGEIFVLFIMTMLMMISYSLNSWLFFALVLGTAIIEWIVNWRCYYIVKNADRNEMGY